MILMVVCFRSGTFASGKVAAQGGMRRVPENDAIYIIIFRRGIVIYHNKQNEKIQISSSRENELGDNNNLETSLNGAQIWP